MYREYLSYCRLLGDYVALTLERRSIVLLAYLLELKDDEIAQRLQMNRSTVQYQRASTLEELRDV